MKNTKDLGTKPIGKLLAQYSIPAVIAMLVNAVYNVVDRIFIGRFAGEGALAGLTIVFPIMLIIFAFAGLVGAGASALMSIRLGEKNLRGASHVFGNSIGLGTIITVGTLLFIFIFLDKLIYGFGGTADTFIYAKTYMQIVLVGFIFQMTSFTLNSTVRTEGKPMLSMIAMLSSAGVNVLLDYIFIVQMSMGVKGAALATISGQLAGFVILLSFYLRGKSDLKVKLNDFIPDIKIYKKIFTIGFATFITTIGVSLSMIVLNIKLLKYGGTAAITSLGAINSLYTLFLMPIMGLQQGIQPIIGYNYGSKLMDRVYKTLKYGLVVAMIFSTIVFIILEIFPTIFIGMFIERSSSTIEVAVIGLRIFIIMLPFLSINMLGIAFFQSVDQGKKSMYLSTLRQIIFLIPLIFILPYFLGLNGIWLATPIADGLAIIVSIIALISNYKKTTNKKNMVLAES